VLTPELLLTLLLFMAGDGRDRGYRHVLDAFWSDASASGVPLPTEAPISASAFCQARAKLSPKFIRRILHGVNERFDSTFSDNALWRGRRVLAVDGTGLNLQRSDDLLRAFGKLDSAYCPQATISTLTNVMSMSPVDVAVGRYKASERDLLLREHLPHLNAGDIVLLDRGYFGFEVFKSLLDAKVDFVARVPASGTFAEVIEFVNSNGRDRIIEIGPTRRSGYPSDEPPLRLRLVRSKRDGEDCLFVTSLMKKDGYSLADIEELYRLRWKAEEHYKAFKSAYMAQEQLHSRTASGVRQEILAISLFHALSRYFLAAAARHVDAPYEQLSNKAACLALADSLVRLFLAHEPDAARWLRELLVRIARVRQKPRPNRSFPRRSYKPRRRWGPRGRSRA